MSTSFFGAPAPKKTTKAASKAAIADRRATANIPAPKTLPASQLQRITQLPAVQTDIAATQRRVASEQAAAAAAAAVQNGTGQVDYGAQTLDNPAPIPPDLSDDALRKSTEYLARERAIQAMLDEFGQKQGTEKTRYEEGYGKSLAELGYDPTNARFDMGEKLTSGERATTSGKAYNALRNDFAARGMLQSGAYQAQQGVLRDQLMKQREAIDTGRTRFLEDQNAALLGQQKTAEDQRRAALEAARQSILNSMGA